MPDRPFAATLLAVALATGCKPAVAPPPSEPRVKLPAPQSMVLSPLAQATSSYTNAMQADYLRDQAAKLGVQRFSQASNLDDPATREVRTPVDFEQGLERTRAMARDFARQRRAISGDQKGVPLLGDTPQLIPTPNGPSSGNVIAPGKDQR